MRCRNALDAVRSITPTDWPSMSSRTLPHVAHFVAMMPRRYIRSLLRVAVARNVFVDEYVDR